MADDTPDTTASQQHKEKSPQLSLLDAGISTLHEAEKFVSAFHLDAQYFKGLHGKSKEESRKELKDLFNKLRCAADVLKREGSKMLPTAVQKLKTVNPYLEGRFPIETLLPEESSSDEDASEAAAPFRVRSPSSYGGAAVGAASGHRRLRELTPDNSRHQSPQKSTRKK